ncbi:MULTISPECIES: metallophosphoesterase [Streptomyces]|uniref:Metallophosphoesterase n=1 Tax=Streptomyces tsukubensis (strain DSM 42081 / NBRC 108919 / NRRL 18488 / 9993) TaxID=1114943 RepID=I2N307_STRT9|nr:MULTISPECIES: metallophosphoesterase [Streptomyces]AZK95552.1 metallophosphoesterase [Streptomyces tsukubensis]EIF91404.1 hydrolase [Streptomyces tsukubensis NRRL18488]MYS66660.1 metallophosphoesterase [Streptomyces sp. SID5473]QKM68410.1 metallophosphoesterase [Streptomyces tsukubensis NRRL18488]TAI43227.1 metallophosphoesterase [Streptomyces tsukubensis]
MRARYGVPLAITAVGAAGIAYAAAFEARSFRLRRLTVPVLPQGMRPLRVLQVSDIHMVSGQRKKRAWLQSLAGLRPDFVINTGDNLSDPEGVPEVLDALGPLMELPGVYVFGSNDYYGPTLRNPARYLLEKAQGRHGLNGNAPAVGVVHNPWEELRDAFDTAGWVGLGNTRGKLKLDAGEIAFTGLDDPHIKRDRYESVAGGPDPAADLSLAVVHAPYLRALDAFTADGYPMIFAGHTHGGQLCIPFYGALVTNCDLDTDRVKGLSTHTAADHTSCLHVSAGCGTSRYTPVRFACPPEATLLTLVERP